MLGPLVKKDFFPSLIAQLNICNNLGFDQRVGSKCDCARERLSGMIIFSYHRVRSRDILDPIDELKIPNKMNHTSLQ